jgi:hypothetical protein
MTQINPSLPLLRNPPKRIPGLELKAFICVNLRNLWTTKIFESLHPQMDAEKAILVVRNDP